MSLPSQTARTSPAGRSFVYRRRRSRRNLGPLAILVGGALIVAVVVGGLLIFRPWGVGADEGASSETAMVDPLVDEGRVDTGPVVMNQGRRNTENERFTRPEPVRTPPATATIPDEDIAIPDLVPPPLDESRGMLDEALASEDSPAVPITGGREQARTAPVEPAPARPAPRAPLNPVAAHIEAADALISRNDPLAARQALWDAFAMPGLDELQQSVLRARLTDLNNDLLFGPVYRTGDPLTRQYEVRAGDSLSRIASREDLGTHWRLIQRVNGLSSPERIRVGQRLKLVPGTFHAVVDKSDFRLDLYHGPTDDPEVWKFVRSFDVGLGEGDSTPIGQFVVRENGKLENPGWVNPRNPAEKYTRDDPGNPIGEFWVGLDGLGDAAAYAGYGIHGTIEPGSIGRNQSMGCVRLRDEDIALLYELLSEGKSLVRIKR
jgi:hypothetical protein